MGSGDYRRLADEALARAHSAGDGIERMSVLKEAASRIPRFPSLASLHVGLTMPVVEDEAGEVAPGFVADAAVLLVRTAILAGAWELADDVATDLEKRVRGVSDQRVKGLGSMARAMVLVTRGRTPGARVELDKARQGCGEEVELDRVLADVIEVALLLAERDEQGAERLARSLLESLDGSKEWDGERFDTYQKLAFVFMNQDRVDEAIQALEEARGLALSHGLATDAGACVLSLVPMLLVSGRTDDAIRLMSETLSDLVSSGEVQEIEMSLRGLMMQALESRGDLAEALSAGFEAVERSKTHGTVDDYVGFVVQMASMYQAGGSPVDAYHMLALARTGLDERDDAGIQAGMVSEALDALRQDVGDDEFERIAAQAEGLDSDLKR